MSKLFKYRKEDEDLFKDVVFIVEATCYEKHSFWQDYHYKPKYENCFIKDWKQECAGVTITIGTCDKRPVCIAIFWDWLDGHKVMFYDACSQVVDHKMVDDWIYHFSKDIKWDNGTRWAHSDSNNFQHCIEAIQDLVKNEDC